MQMLNRALAVAVFLAGTVAFAQQDAPQPAKGKEQTLTGCLTKGADQPQHYTFAAQNSGKKMTVTGPADLEKHSANHTVRITGRMTNKVFEVTKVEHVSPTCEAKGGSGATK
jgi:hypothetical protein